MNPSGLEQVRQINQALPFAHPIEQGEESSTRWLMVFREGGEVPAVGDKIRGWADIIDAAVPGSIKLIGNSPTDPKAPFHQVFGNG